MTRENTEDTPDTSRRLRKLSIKWCYFVADGIPFLANWYSYRLNQPPSCARPGTSLVNGQTLCCFVVALVRASLFLCERMKKNWTWENESCIVWDVDKEKGDRYYLKRSFYTANITMFEFRHRLDSCSLRKNLTAQSLSVCQRSVLQGGFLPSWSLSCIALQRGIYVSIWATAHFPLP